MLSMEASSTERTSQRGFHSVRPSGLKCLSCLSGVSTHLSSGTALAFGVRVQNKALLSLVSA